MDKRENQLYIEILMQKALGLLRAYKAVFTGTFLFGLLTHGFAFTNKLINHDDVHSLFSLGTTIASGRWALELLKYILPNYSMPLFNGILTISLIGISVCFMVDLFQVKRPISRFVLAALVISFPSLTGTFSFMYTSTAYAISFLMAVISAWKVSKDERRSFLVAIIPMVFSLGIYQAYISLTASLLVLVILKKLLERNEMEMIWVSAVRYVAFLLISLGIYYLIMRLSQSVTGVSMGAYAERRFNTDTISAFTDNFAHTVGIYIDFFREGDYGLIAEGCSMAIHVVLLVLSTVLLVLWCIKMKNWVYSGMLFVVLTLYPVSVNCLYLILSIGSFHTIVLYGAVTLYLLFVIVLENALSYHDQMMACVSKIRKVAAEMILAGMLIISVVNVSVGNQAYLKLYLKYENNYAFYTTVLAQIQARDDFDEDSKIALIGTHQSPEFYMENFVQANHIGGVKGVNPVQYSNHEFVLYYLGLDIPFASSAEIKEIAKTQEFQQMANYPYSGCITKIGSCIVVKFSDYPIDS